MRADFIDASFYIALIDDKDQWHRRALALKTDLSSSPVTTNLVAAEVLASIGSRKGGKKALTVWHALEDSGEVVFVTRDQWKPALDLVLVRDGRLSIADACSVVVMLERHLKRIVSFDEGFDSIAGVERLH